MIGEAYRDLGRYDEGERCLEESAQVLRELAWVDTLRHMVHSLGDLALDAGRHESARSHYQEAFRANIEVGGKREEAYCVAGIASVLAESGRPEEAVRLWGAAEAAERELGFRMISYERERYARRVAALAADPRYAKAYEEGATLSREQASAEALDVSL